MKRESKWSFNSKFAKKNGQVPLFYNERNSGRPANNRYIDIDCEPLFPFGYGLSYSTFDYSDMSIAKQQIENNENFEVSVTVKNTGKYIGKEFVQLYIHDKVASITQPRNKLVDFQKIELKPSESKRITFIVSSKELAILDKNMKLIVEPGEFDIWIGQNCKDEKNHIVIIVK